MAEVTHVPGTGMAALCSMVGHGLKIVYADSAGNLYSLDSDESMIHALDGGDA